MVVCGLCQSFAVSVLGERAYLDSKLLPGTKDINREKEIHCRLVEYKICLK